MKAIPTQPASLRLVPVAIYTRVSTLDQVGGRFDSCESQEALCREHVQKHAAEGWYISGVFSDPAYSGGSLRRPGMQSLMRHIESGAAKVVLIFKFERVLRSTDDWVPFRAFLRKHHCRLESPTENLSDETATERFHNNLRANLAQYERDNTSDKVRIKMLEQAKRGLWNAGQVPYGYDYNKETQTLHPNPTDSLTIRRIFEAAAKLVPLTDLANALNAEGLRTRQRIFKRRDGTAEQVGGRRFRSDVLRKIICNPIYTGVVRFHGEAYPGKHPALVSKDLFERASAAVSERPVPISRLQSRDKHHHLLKGLVFCGCCKRSMIPDASGTRDSTGRVYRYYTCGHAHKEKSDSPCRVRRVQANALEHAIIRKIGDLVRNPDVIQAATEATQSHTTTDRTRFQRDQTRNAKELSTVNTKLGHCIDTLAAGGAELLTEELRERISNLKTDKQRLVVEREHLRQELEACNRNTLEADRIHRALTRFHDVLPQLAPADQKQLMGLCISQIEIQPASPKTTTDPHRDLNVRIRFHVAQLVGGMESSVVVRGRTAPLGPVRDRPLMIDARVALTAPPPEKKAAAEKPTPPFRHPIHRALSWQKLLEKHPELTHAEFGKKHGISAPTLSRHLQLLHLVPEIRDRLFAIRTQREARSCSLNRLIPICPLPADQQLKRFTCLGV